jgi:hypothetical protein
MVHEATVKAISRPLLSIELYELVFFDLMTAPLW